MKKSLSVILSTCLFWTSQGTVQGATVISDLIARPSGLPQFQLIPPATLGRVSDYFNAPANAKSEPAPLVVLIQDLHAHYGVQKNIAGLLDFLDLKLSGRFAIGVEGAQGPIDNSTLALFPDTQVKMAATDYLMREGELTGADYFTIHHHLPKALTGVENDQFYTMNRDLFRKTFTERSELTQVLSDIQKELNDVDSRICSKNVRGFSAREKAFDQGELSTEQFLTYLIHRAQQVGFSVDELKKNLPSLATFISQSGVEASLRQQPSFLEHLLDPSYVPLSAEELRIKTANFLRGIQDSLSAEERANLALYAKSSTPLYYQYLRDLVYEHQFFLAVPPDLAGYLEYVHTSQTVGLDRVRYEARELSFIVKKRLAKTQEEKDFIQVQHDAALLGRLIDLQATEYEVRNFAPRMNQFVAMCGSLLTSSAELGSKTKREFDGNTLRQLISASVDFYAVAMMRNKPMVDNTLTLLGKRVSPSFKNQNRVAVLIAGGFHTAPLTQLLRDKNISYIVLTPTVNAISVHDHELYVKRLNGELLTEDEIVAQAADETSLLTQAVSACAVALSPGERLVTASIVSTTLAVVSGIIHKTGTREVDFGMRGNHDLGLVDRVEHEKFNEKVRPIIEAIGQEIGASIRWDGRLDIRDVVKKAGGRIDKGSLKIWIEPDGLLVIVDPRFKKLDHPGRDEFSAYASNEKLAQHEISELRFAATYALQGKIATEQDILRGLLGTRYREWLNDSRPTILLRNRLALTVHLNEFHNAGLDAEKGNVVPPLQGLVRAYSLTPGSFFGSSERRSGTNHEEADFEMHAQGENGDNNLLAIVFQGNTKLYRRHLLAARIIFNLIADKARQGFPIQGNSIYNDMVHDFIAKTTGATANATHASGSSLADLYASDDWSDLKAPLLTKMVLAIGGPINAVAATAVIHQMDEAQRTLSDASEEFRRASKAKETTASAHHEQVAARARLPLLSTYRANGNDRKADFLESIGVMFLWTAIATTARLMPLHQLTTYDFTGLALSVALGLILVPVIGAQSHAFGNGLLEVFDKNGKVVLEKYDFQKHFRPLFKAFFIFSIPSIALIALFFSPGAPVLVAILTIVGVAGITHLLHSYWWNDFYVQVNPGTPRAQAGKNAAINDLQNSAFGDDDFSSADIKKEIRARFKWWAPWRYRNSSRSELIARRLEGQLKRLTFPEDFFDHQAREALRTYLKATGQSFPDALRKLLKQTSFRFIPVNDGIFEQDRLYAQAFTDETGLLSLHPRITFAVSPPQSKASFSDDNEYVLIALHQLVFTLVQQAVHEKAMPVLPTLAVKELADHIARLVGGRLVVGRDLTASFENLRVDSSKAHFPELEKVDSSLPIGRLGHGITFYQEARRTSRETRQKAFFERYEAQARLENESLIEIKGVENQIKTWLDAHPDSGENVEWQFDVVRNSQGRLRVIFDVLAANDAEGGFIGVGTVNVHPYSKLLLNKLRYADEELVISGHTHPYHPSRAGLVFSNNDFERHQLVYLAGADKPLMEVQSVSSEKVAVLDQSWEEFPLWYANESGFLSGDRNSRHFVRPFHADHFDVRGRHPHRSSLVDYRNRLQASTQALALALAEKSSSPDAFHTPLELVIDLVDGWATEPTILGPPTSFAQALRPNAIPVLAAYPDNVEVLDDVRKRIAPVAENKSPNLHYIVLPHDISLANAIGSHQDLSGYVLPPMSEKGLILIRSLNAYFTFFETASDWLERVGKELRMNPVIVTFGHDIYFKPATESNWFLVGHLDDVSGSYAWLPNPLPFSLSRSKGIHPTSANEKKENLDLSQAATFNSDATSKNIWQWLRWTLSLANPGHELGHYPWAAFLGMALPKVNLGFNPHVETADWEHSLRDSTPLGAARWYGVAFFTALAGVAANALLIVGSAAAIYFIHPHSLAGILESLYAVFVLIFNGEVLWINFKDSPDLKQARYFAKQAIIAAGLGAELYRNKSYRRMTLKNLSSISTRAVSLINSITEHHRDTNKFHSGAGDRTSADQKAFAPWSLIRTAEGPTIVLYVLIKESSKGWLVAKHYETDETWNIEHLSIVPAEALLQRAGSHPLSSVSPTTSETLLGLLRLQSATITDVFQERLRRPPSLDEIMEALSYTSASQTSEKAAIAVTDEIASDVFKRIAGTALPPTLAEWLWNEANHSKNKTFVELVAHAAENQRKALKAIFFEILKREPSDAEIEEIFEQSAKLLDEPKSYAQTYAEAIVKKASDEFNHLLLRDPTKVEIDHLIQEANRTGNRDLVAVTRLQAQRQIEQVSRGFYAVAGQYPVPADMEAMIISISEFDPTKNLAFVAGQTFASTLLQHPNRFEIGTHYSPQGHLINGGQSPEMQDSVYVVVDWNHDQALQLLYRSILHPFLPRFTNGYLAGDIKGELLQAIMVAVRTAHAANGWKNAPSPYMLLGSTIGHTEDPRYMAYLTAALLEHFIQENILAGQVYYVTGATGQPSVRYYASSEDPFVLDPVARETIIQQTVPGAFYETKDRVHRFYSADMMPLNSHMVPAMKSNSPLSPTNIMHLPGNDGAKAIGSTAGDFGLSLLSLSALHVIWTLYGTHALLISLAMVSAAFLPYVFYLLVKHTAFGPWLLKVWTHRVQAWQRYRIISRKTSAAASVARSVTGADFADSSLVVPAGAADALDASRRNLTSAQKSWQFLMNA